MKFKTKKLIAAAVLLITFLGILAPQVTNAQRVANTQTGQSIWSCFTNPFSCTVSGLSVVINSLLGLLVAVGAWFVRLGLQFNEHIVDSPAVQSGFGVALAVANLGFVLAIIVVALATILRRETYGIKQILWKLVVAAIIVNFSLVIAGAILGFSDSLTRYFMRAAVPTPVGAPLDYGGFILELTGAFNPQAFFQPPPTAKELTPIECSKHGKLWAWICGFNVGIILAGTDQASGFVSSVIGAALSAVFLLLIAFTFLALAVMLLIRYVYIGILLILAPLVWLLWIFPNTQSHFSKWWNAFIRWTFFPPIVVFFLYLAILTVTGSNRADYLENIQIPPQSGTGQSADVAAAIAQTTGNPTLVRTIGSNIIMIALVLGGLFAANSLSITGASVAMGLAKGAGGFVQGYVSKQGKKLGGAAYRGVGGVGYREKLQKGELKGVGRIIPGRLQSLMGRGMSQLERGGGANLVENEKKWAAQFTDPKEMAALLAGSLPKEKQIALIKRMTETEDLGEVKNINGVNRDGWIKDNEKAFKDYGQGKFYEKDLQKSQLNIKVADIAKLAVSTPSVEIEDTGDIMGKGQDPVTKQYQKFKAVDLLDESMKQFARKLERADVSKFDLNHLFKTKTLDDDPATKMRMDAFLRKIASQNHELVPGMMSQMKGEQKTNFLEMYREAIKSEVVVTNLQTPTTPKEITEKTAAVARLAIAQEAVDRILLNLAAYAGGGRDGGVAGGGAAAATP